MPPVELSKIRSVRAHEQILDQLQQMILRGELPPGARLPSERAMMTKFEVSRPTVREALRVAEHLGLVSVRQGDPGGPLVVARPSAGIAHVMDAMLETEQASAADLLELRMALDGTAAALASDRRKAELAGIGRAYRDMQKAVDGAAFVTADARFHYEIALASGNRLLPLILEALEAPIRRLIESGPASNREITLAQHGKILEAIRGGRAMEARRAAQRHLFDLYTPVLGAAECARLEIVLGR